jgi:hypothetical protein
VKQNAAVPQFTLVVQISPECSTTHNDFLMLNQSSSYSDQRY